MKRNNLQWAVPMAILCLLTVACSKDDSPIDTSTRSLTIRCDINNPKATNGSRASIVPSNTEQNMEKFAWHAGDNFQGWLIPYGSDDYDSNPATFDIDGTYNTPSASASFTCPNFPNKKFNYKMLVIHPVGKFTPATNEVTFQSKQIQTGKNDTRHLNQYMNMYATAIIDSGIPAPKLSFQHLTSILRFTVKNANASACRITEVAVTTASQSEIFEATLNLVVSNWEKGLITLRSTQSFSELTLGLKESSDSEKGIQLSARNVADPAAKDLNAYATVRSNPLASLTGQKLVFKLSITNADGSNPRQYNSPELDAERIFKATPDTPYWLPGQCYWFDLVLADQLSVNLKQVTQMPGWNDETNL